MILCLIDRVWEGLSDINMFYIQSTYLRIGPAAREGKGSKDSRGRLKIVGMTAGTWPRSCDEGAIASIGAIWSRLLMGDPGGRFGDNKERRKGRRSEAWVDLGMASPVRPPYRFGSSQSWLPGY